MTLPIITVGRTLVRGDDAKMEVFIPIDITDAGFYGVRVLYKVDEDDISIRYHMTTLGRADMSDFEEIDSTECLRRVNDCLAKLTDAVMAGIDGWEVSQ